MFFEAKTKGYPALKHDPFLALVSPRPIGWISTVDRNGNVNLAPFSLFNAVSYEPHVIMFSASGLPDDPMKHSRRNAEETGEFVCNIVPHALRLQMCVTSLHVPRGVNEMKMVGLIPEPSVMVKPPRVREAPAHLECAYLRTVEFKSSSRHNGGHGVVFGEVVGVHIKDEFVVNGIVDVRLYKPVARMGYQDYTTVETLYAMNLPDMKVKLEQAAAPDHKE